MAIFSSHLESANIMNTIHSCGLDAMVHSHTLNTLTLTLAEVNPSFDITLLLQHHASLPLCVRVLF